MDHVEVGGLRIAYRPAGPAAGAAPCEQWVHGYLPGLFTGTAPAELVEEAWR